LIAYDLTIFSLFGRKYMIRLGVHGLASLLFFSAAVSAQVPAPSPAPTAPPKDVRYVIMHTPGPKWQPGKPIFEQAGVREHIEHYRRLQTEGKLVLGGPFLDSAGGGMMIPEAGLPEAELTAFAQDDPAVKAGLLQVTVRPWLIGMRKKP
jgi:uncharacterized protein YciI